MIDIGLAWVSYARTRRRLAALVGPRMYPDAAPQDAPTPYLVYSRADYEPDDDLSGGVGHAASTLTIDAVADTKAIAERIRALVAEAVGYRGQWGTARVNAVRTANPSDNYWEPQVGENAGKYQRSLDLIISHLER